MLPKPHRHGHHTHFPDGTEGDKAETVTPHAELGEEWNARAGAQGQMKEIWKETKQQPNV